MRKADYICDVCGEEKKDYPLEKKAPRHCRKVMRRKYAPVAVSYRGDGWTGAQKEER